VYFWKERAMWDELQFAIALAVSGLSIGSCTR